MRTANAILTIVVCVTTFALYFTRLQLVSLRLEAAGHNRFEFAMKAGIAPDCQQTGGLLWGGGYDCSVLLPSGPLRFTCDADRCVLVCGGGK